MNIKKGSGFLASDYYECESCEVSFAPSGKENYHLKDYKEKTFLENHKNRYVPYDTWVKIGQGEYTPEQQKEEAKLEFVEKLDINCPTCDTPFNKYHKKGMLTFDSIICPTCKARYEIFASNSYRFINIPNINSKLWEHYNEKLTIEEIYAIFDKKIENNESDNSEKTSNPLEFKCMIREERPGFSTNDRDRDKQNAIVYLSEDSLIIKKKFIMEK